MAEIRRLTLQRQKRVLKRPRFVTIKQQGKRLIYGCLILNWKPNPAAAFSRVGTITSRRIGGAVERNRARRLMRESFRHLQHQIETPADVVLVARRSIQHKRQPDVEADFRVLLRRAGLLKPIS